MKKTTIVIPNYNGINFIEGCLRSIFADDAEAKVIVVDNGSSDGSTKCLKNFPKVELIELWDNTGFSHAVNVGIQAADTEYVLLLNNDTEVAAGFLAAMEKALDRHPKAFSVSSQMRNLYRRDEMDNAGDLYTALGWARARGGGKDFTPYQREKKVFSACAGAAIYRKAIFEEIGYFDETHFAYLEDVDVGYRARIYGYENWYTPDAVVYHAGSGSSGSKYNAFKINLSSRNSIYIIGKNMPLLQILINLPFFLIGFLLKILFFAKKGFGLLYIKGLGKGFGLSFSETGKEKHVPFEARHFLNYLRIELELLINMFRVLFGCDF